MTVLHPEASSGATPTRRRRAAVLARMDLALVLALMAVGAALVWSTSARFDPRFFKEPDGNDVWFEADLPTVADRVLHRWSDQSRNARHPLFPLMVAAPANVLAPVVGDQTALRLLIAAIAAMWIAAMYVLLRAVTPRRLDAVIFTALAASSAAAVFWLPVPETYALGSISIIVALALAAWDPFGRAGAAAYVGAAAFSLAVTTTNWVSGLATLAARRPPRAALQLAANSLTAVVVLWSLQHLLFSSAPFFIGEGVQTRFILPDGAAGIAQALRAVLFHSIVMPAIQTVPEPKWGTIMSVQDAAIASGGTVALVATALWAAVLGLGAWAAATRPSPVRVPLLLALAGHLVVYAIYGEETFLYTLHIVPLLVCVAALTTTTTLRPMVLGAAAVLTLLLAAHNTQALAGALAFFDVFRT